MKLALLLCCFHILTVAGIRTSLLYQFAADQNMMGKGTAKTRLHEIYCYKTGGRVRIQGKKVDARGVRGDKYSQMELSSVNIKGQITIKGVETGRYLCMNKKGRLLPKLHRGTGPISDNCIFTQHILVSNWDIFTNLRHPNWVIAFNGNGRPKKGPKTSPNKREAHFLRMPPKGVSAGDIVRTEYSPSALDNDEWDKYTEELQNSLRSSHLSSMQGDDPRIWQSEIPLDVQEELEKRRKEKEQWEKSKMLSSTIQPSPTTADSGRSSDRFRKERHRKNKNRRNRRKEKRQKLSATDVTISNSDVTANLVNDNNNARPFKLNGYSLTTKEDPVRHSRQSSRNRRSKNLSTRKRRKNRKQLKQSREIT